MLLKVIDFETCGLAPPAGVCEVGWVDVVQLPESTQWAAHPPISTLVNPGQSIPPESSAVHGITDADVDGAPSFHDVIARMLKEPMLALAGHNIKFELKWLPPNVPDDFQLIDTYAIALRLAPQAPSHSLQALRYWLKLDVGPSGEPKHRAGPDSYTTAKLLIRMLAKLPVEKLIAISSEPILLPRINFGKHKSKPFSALPLDYLDWLLSQSDMDADVLYAAKHELERRATEATTTAIAKDSTT